MTSVPRVTKYAQFHQVHHKLHFLCVNPIISPLSHATSHRANAPSETTAPVIFPVMGHDMITITWTSNRSEFCPLLMRFSAGGCLTCQKKDPYNHHHLPCGQQRLLDIHFRHLRYESTESLIDACYHASQQLTRLISEPQAFDYDDRMVTIRGFRYSLFRDIAFEEIIFNYQKGMTLRVSFACPKGLRGRRSGPSKHLEEGMLVALIGLDGNDSLSTTFMEIYQRQTTEAMRPRTGNDLRGQYPFTIWY